MSGTRPNVLLVVLDSVRARNTSLHGHHNHTTPFLDTLSEEAGTVYTQARAPSNRSLPSHASMFLGTPVHEHGVTQITDRLDPADTVFQWLARQGYETAAFSENPFLTQTANGLKDSFAHVAPPATAPYANGLNPDAMAMEETGISPVEFLLRSLQDSHPLKSLANGAYTKLSGTRLEGLLPFTTTDGAYYAEQATDWMTATDGPWAACINLMDGHAPYTPSDEVNQWGDDELLNIQHTRVGTNADYYAGKSPWWTLEAMEALYDGCIAEADDAVKLLVDALKHEGLFEDTLIVVTSDHGELFGTPSELRPDLRLSRHGIGLTEEHLHVPLYVKYPQQTTTQRNHQLATLTEFPAVVEALVEEDAREEDVTDLFTTEKASASIDSPPSLVADALDAADVDSFYRQNTIDVVYQQDEDWIRKAARGPDTAVEHRIFSAHEKQRLSTEPDSTLFKDFASRSDAATQETVDEPDDSALQSRLKNLGYME